MAGSGSFLQRSRHGTMYFFRRRVPTDLRVTFGQAHIHRSLNTGCLRSARIAARKLASETDMLFVELRAMPKDKQDCQQVPRFAWGEWGGLDAQEPSRRSAPSLAPTPTAPVLPTESGARTISVPGSAACFSAPYTLQWGNDASGARVLTGLEVEPGNEQDHRLALEALAALQGWLPILGRPIPAPAVPTPLQPVPEPFKGMLMGEAVRNFLAAADVKPASLKNYRSYLHRIAIPFFGESCELASIDQKRFSMFVEHVITLGKAAGTSEGYVSALTSMGKWHRARGENIPLWESATLLPRQRNPESDDRSAFSLAELQNILKNAAKYRAKVPEKFWVTACVAFLGCRVEEISQVNLKTDLHHDTERNIHYLTFNERPDDDGGVRKSIKKKASFRVAPIHSSLIEAGILDFFKLGIRNLHTRPFEKIFPFRALPLNIPGRPAAIMYKFAHEISKWGGKELRHLYTTGAVQEEKGKSYFHSMRHTFSTYLSSQGVPEEHRNLLSGHAFGGENAGRYTKTRTDPVFLSALVEAHMDEYAKMLRTAIGTVDATSPPL